MNTIERYLQAAVRDNTRRSYQAAVEHFEVSWEAFCRPPPTASSATWPSMRTATRSAPQAAPGSAGAMACQPGLSRPTKAPMVRQLLKGIRTLHPAEPKQAAPLLIQHLQTAVGVL
nr:hypothetical protein [Pseudomonas sp. BIGb0427]